MRKDFNPTLFKEADLRHLAKFMKKSCLLILISIDNDILFVFLHSFINFAAFLAPSLLKTDYLTVGSCKGFNENVWLMWVFYTERKREEKRSHLTHITSCAVAKHNN